MEPAFRRVPNFFAASNCALLRVAVDKSPANYRIVVFSLLGCTVIAVAAGCHRQMYRKRADREAHGLIAEKSRHIARPPVRAARIDIDQRSRMFNPFDLDFQPMPLDDPSSHRYMQCVDGRRGYPLWHAAGVTNTTENPDWWQFLPLDEDGVLVLNADKAVEIALLHSPDYQRQLEQLFLSALDVSSERFRFETQFFGGVNTAINLEGAGIDSATGRRSTYELGLDSNGRRDLALQRAFATGGDLVVGVANNIVWTISGPSTQSASTLLDFSLLQPLLRGAGRDRVLERLTLSERRLLANVRSFERYRRSFYLNITVGRGIESTVQRSGGVFGVGLGGFTGLGSGFAGLGGGGGGGGVGFGGGVPEAGGFFGLLQDQLQIRNLEENIARLAENLIVLDNTLIELLTTIPDDPEAIIRQRLQVAQARSALLSAQSQLLSQQAAYQASLDRFLGQLGLPPYICVRIEDPVLERFELIDRALRSRRETLIGARTAVGQINVELLGETESVVDPDTGLPETRIEWTPAVAEKFRRLREEIQPLVEFNKMLLEEDLPRIAVDIERLGVALPERQSQNDGLIEIYQRERENICTLLNVRQVDESVFDIRELPGIADRLQVDYAKLQMRLDSYTQRLLDLDATIARYIENGGGDATPRDLAKQLREEVIIPSQDVLADLGDDVLDLQLIQARARTESVLLPTIDIDPATAFQIARKNRRDYANARAALVDSWRLIEFNADDLESSLDLEFSGGVANDGNNPFNIDGDSASLRVGLAWDAPITRLQERNTYRQSLIEFEQAKRSYYQFEDGIWQLLRGEVRQLQLNQFNFELGRQSVRIAASQIELNDDIRAFRDARGLASGPTAARDTITALEALLNSQNSLLNIYVNYEVVRRSLDFDLGTMELTPEGLWIDPGAVSADQLLLLPGTSADGMLDCGCTECGLRLESSHTEAIYGETYQLQSIDESQHSHHEIAEPSMPPTELTQPVEAEVPTYDLPAPVKQ